MHVTLLHLLSCIKLLSILRLMPVMIRHMSHDRNNVGVHRDKASQWWIKQALILVLNSTTNSMIIACKCQKQLLSSSLRLSSKCFSAHLPISSSFIAFLEFCYKEKGEDIYLGIFQYKLWLGFQCFFMRACAIVIRM